MPREATVDSRQEILRTAARLFQQRGYDATSMNDVAAALKLSKGGLYHHFQSKDERLKTLIKLRIEVVLSVRDREVTVMLHENHPLPPSLRKQINNRKKDYIHFVENLIAEVQRLKGCKGKVTP